MLIDPCMVDVVGPKPYCDIIFPKPMTVLSVMIDQADNTIVPPPIIPQDLKLICFRFFANQLQVKGARKNDISNRKYQILFAMFLSKGIVAVTSLACTSPGNQPLEDKKP